MSTGNTKRTVGRASRLLAMSLVGLALLVLIAAGIHTRPRTANAANDTSVGAVVNNEALTVSAETAADKRSSQKTRTMPPPPPPAPAEPTDAPAQPPQPPQPAQSAQPAQPAQPAQTPQEPQPATPPTPPTPPAPETPNSEKQDKDKPSKEKSKDKSKAKVKKGALIEAPQPAYPDEIKAQKIEGTVAVLITIGDDGNVINVKADSGPKELYAVSEAAARRARFQPTLVDGKPAKVTGVVTYNFKLAE